MDPAREGCDLTVVDLAIIGSFPPPFGGVATHVQRLLPLLRARGVSFRVYNAVSDSESLPDVVSVVKHRRLWLLVFLLTCKEQAILILSDRLGVWSLAVIVGRLRGKKVAVRLRNSMLSDLDRAGGWGAWLSRKIICRMDLVICVNTVLLSLTRKFDVPDERSILAPGFLPPTDRCQDASLVDQAVWRFLKGKNPILAANGKIRWYQGADLYGLDLLIDLVARLKPEYPGIALIVCFWEHNSKDEERLHALNEKVLELGLKESIFFNTKPGVFIPVLAKASVFIRPTATDGDANSIREALALKIPVVASNVIERPDGCFIHKSRDVESLTEITRLALDLSTSYGKSTGLMVNEETRMQIAKYIDCIQALVHQRQT